RAAATPPGRADDDRRSTLARRYELTFACCERRRPPLVVHANTVVRLDPRTNAVTRVIGVGKSPMAVAAAGRSVWTYNADEGSVTEVLPHAAGARRRRQPAVSTRHRAKGGRGGKRSGVG